MKIYVRPGKYVVSVSGGVDSIALLDLLAHNPKVDLVVAHYDHGIRGDSAEDRKLVEQLVKSYGLEFFFEKGELGPSASEALAREKRYEFLRKVKDQVSADAIVTAHHQDDVLETAILNLLRGTGRKGLSSLRSSAEIKRPLLSFPKSELIAYARAHHLQWHEDSTNADETYLRNYVRRQIMPRLSPRQRAELLSLTRQAAVSNQAIDEHISQALSIQLADNQLNRRWFVSLPHAVAKEVMATWLRQNGAELDRRLVERLVVAAKTYAPGKQTSVNKGLAMQVSTELLALVNHER